MPKSKWTGKSLNKRYLIDEMLGQGGMSAVFKATDPNLKRVVAVKMIHSHLSNNPDFVKRFEEEAAAVAQLRHPGIIQVYDFSQDDDIYYMVLEFVPGETIQDHLKRLNTNGRRLSAAKAIEYMANICDAVDYAHQRGMIHRDIKPANLMLNTLGQVILMDFGIAKIVGGQSHTATGAVIGTAMYMSPEQIKGERPDRRSDIYSLGVTLFEMVSGRPPFEADSAMTLMMMHINDPVPNLKSLNPDVPDELMIVINKALAKDPNDRYQTAAQMAAALRNVLGLAQSGASRDIPAADATMMEKSPLSFAGPAATMYEPSVEAKGTVVESGPLPTPYGTVVESNPLQTPYGASSGGGTGVRGTSIEGSAVRPNTTGAVAPPKKRALALPLIIGGLLGVGCLIFGGIFLVSNLLGNEPNSPTAQPVIPVVINTDGPTATFAAEATLAVATEIPTETAIPLSPTPDTPYVVISGIRLENAVYVVDYDVNNFPDASNLHVHIFFNNIPPEQAGSPGSGPWKLTWGSYGDPPFTQYIVSSRPPDATQMCALVANPNHSIQLNSGNCVDLPQ
ncbi:MAG: serine/threonine protein kinase [Anaerolineales bacterium]|nr:serine/threonine protein kinase [Anaerolineales bacterium]